MISAPSAFFGAIVARAWRLGKATAMVTTVLVALFAAWPALALANGEVTVQTRQGPLTFFVEVAATPGERSRGLMFRKELAKDHGMLFVFDQTRPVSFWMDNTPIPLDLLFVDDQGAVVTVRENAVPYSQDLIPSGGPVRYVLEIPGGSAERRGIRVGDQLRSDLIPKR